MAGRLTCRGRRDRRGVGTARPRPEGSGEGTAGGEWRRAQPEGNGVEHWRRWPEGSGPSGEWGRGSGGEVRLEAVVQSSSHLLLPIHKRTHPLQS